MDTVSLAWRLSPGGDEHLRLVRELRAPASVPASEGRPALRTRPGGAGAVSVELLNPPSPGEKWGGGLHLGYFQNGLVFGEGRLAALLAGAASNHELATVSALPAAGELMRAAWATAGVALSGQPVVRRLDLAVDLLFDRPADGLAFLDAAAHLTVPRLKVDAWRHNGRTETVALRTPKRGAVVARLYDKGVEAGSHPPGIRIRFERQVRLPASDQPTAASLVRRSLGAMVEAPLRAWSKAAPRVAVGGIGAAQERVLDAVEQGRITPRRAERVLGSLVIAGRLGGDAAGWWSSQTGARRRAELRELGIVLDPLSPSTESREVPVGALLASLADTWRPS